MVPSKKTRKSGVTNADFEGRAVENFYLTLNISKTGGTIFLRNFQRL